MRDPAIRTRAAPAIALAALAIIQIAFLGRPPDADREGYVVVGDDLSSVRVRGADGTSRPLAGQGPVLVLVFDPECEHSQRVAPEWRSWFQSAGEPSHVVALAAGSFPEANQHADAHGWTFPVVSVIGDFPGSREHALVSRTPWIFALDGSGQVTAQVHGGELSAIIATLKRPSVARFASRSEPRELSHR